MLANVRSKTKGDCDCCIRTEVELTIVNAGRNSMLMCDVCFAAEQATKNAVKVIETSRAIDASLELKQDIFTAATVSFVELTGAIENNSEIPADKKNFAIMEEVAARIQKLDSVIFAEEASLLAKKNERHALLVNAQNVAAKLHEAEREKFKQYDVNYKPQTPKSMKPVKAPKTPTKTKAFSKNELMDAAKKYNVPASRIQLIVVARKGMISPEDAAKELASMMGLL